MSTDLEETIRQNAQGPAKVETDAGKVEQHPLPDLIEADKHLAAKEAAKSKTGGLRIQKLIPPGTT